MDMPLDNVHPRPVAMTETKRTADFVPLFTRHGRQLYAYILTLMGNDPGADDVFQETSTLMWEKFEQFEPGTNFVAWGCRIAYFRVLNYRKSRRQQTLLFSEAFYQAIESEVASQSDDLDTELRALEECYSKLSQQERDLIDRRYSSQATVKQLASNLGRPLSTVYRMLDRVHAALLNCIENASKRAQDKPINGARP
jgi:RNA polymerase sigma-70 factor, ECF subfamily